MTTGRFVPVNQAVAAPVRYIPSILLGDFRFVARYADVPGWQDYGISESFFKEIDASVKKHCRTQNDVQAYLFMYQGFSNDLMMLMGNLMQWKFRMPSIFKGALRSMTEKTVHEVCTKTVWKKDDVHKTAMTVRQYKERLGYSEQWMTEYVYNIVMLAKKEPKKKGDEQEKA